MGLRRVGAEGKGPERERGQFTLRADLPPIDHDLLEVLVVILVADLHHLRDGGSGGMLIEHRRMNPSGESGEVARTATRVRKECTRTIGTASPA